MLAEINSESETFNLPVEIQARRKDQYKKLCNIIQASPVLQTFNFETSQK